MKLLTFFLIVTLIFGIISCSSKNPTGPVNLTNKLVAYYPFNGNANDESGNGNNGIINGASLTTDRFGNPNRAYRFDGNDDYIDCGNDSSLNFKDVISVSVWMKRDLSVSYNPNAAISKQEDSGYGLYMNLVNLGSPTPRPFFDVYIDGGWRTARVSDILEHDKWSHLVGVYDGNTVKLYVDGFLQTNSTSITGQITICPFNLLIGANPGHGRNYYYFHGDIDDVRLYNRALNNKEIQKLYHEGGW